MNMQTPLAKARGLGSAKQGMHHWWMQRLTAIALIPLSLWFVYSLTMINTFEYAQLTAWLGEPVNATLILLFLFSLYYHAWLGLQVVIEDYIDSEWRRITCLILVKFIICLAGFSAALSVLKIYLGM